MDFPEFIKLAIWKTLFKERLYCQIYTSEVNTLKIGSVYIARPFIFVFFSNLTTSLMWSDAFDDRLEDWQILLLILGFLLVRYKVWLSLNFNFCVYARVLWVFSLFTFKVGNSFGLSPFFLLSFRRRQRKTQTNNRFFSNLLIWIFLGGKKSQQRIFFI